MSAHTPGPWHQDMDAPLVVSTDDYEIAHCLLKPAHGQAEANARLIAAAPDLLAALREVVDAYDLNVVGHAEINLARAAIAKAEVQS